MGGVGGGEIKFTPKAQSEEITWLLERAFHTNLCTRTPYSNDRGRDTYLNNATVA